MVALDTPGHRQVAGAGKIKNEEQNELAVDVERGTENPLSASVCIKSSFSHAYPVICQGCLPHPYPPLGMIVAAYQPKEEKQEYCSNHDPFNGISCGIVARPPIAVIIAIAAIVCRIVRASEVVLSLPQEVAHGYANQLKTRI